MGKNDCKLSYFYPMQCNAIWIFFNAKTDVFKQINYKYDLQIKRLYMIWFIFWSTYLEDPHLGVKGYPVLSKLANFDIISYALRFLGIHKKFLNVLLNYQLKEKEKVNIKMSSIRPPNHFYRFARKFDHLKRWKSIEFEIFIMYYFVYSFENNIKDFSKIKTIWMNILNSFMQFQSWTKQIFIIIILTVINVRYLNLLILFLSYSKILINLTPSSKSP